MLWCMGEVYVGVVLDILVNWYGVSVDMIELWVLLWEIFVGNVKGYGCYIK